MEEGKNLSLSLMGDIFTAYREKVLSGCPEGFDLRAEVGVGGKITIVFKRDSKWFHASSFYGSKVDLLGGLVERLTDLGWSATYNIETLP